MMSRNRIIIIGVSAISIILMILWAWSAWVSGPAAVLGKRISAERASFDRRNSDLDKAEAIEERIAAITSHTLGGTTEAVDHALRSRLAALAESAQVTDVSVSTSSPITVDTPGKSAFRSRSVRELRDEPDFMLVPASISASGTWPQVTGLIDAIRAEPWPHKIVRVRLAQRDDGKRIEATVQLQTLFVPGSLPDGGEIRPVQLAVRLNQVNPFAPPYVPPPKPPPDTPRPTPPPNWRVTMIGTVEGEPEVLLVDRKGKRTRLTIGQTLVGCTFVQVERDADGIDIARFAVADNAEKTWLVAPGGALRRP